MAYQVIRRALLESRFRIKKLNGVSTLQASYFLDLDFQSSANAASTLTADFFRIFGEEGDFDAKSTIDLIGPSLVINLSFSANAASGVTTALPPLRLMNFAANSTSGISSDASAEFSADSKIDGKGALSAEYLRIMNENISYAATSTLTAEIYEPPPPPPITGDYRIFVTNFYKVEMPIDGIEWAATDTVGGLEVGEVTSFILVDGIDIFGSNHEG